ncbi:unnamed protein product [Adineta ricciae]|uniref:Uncharacterized protein n=1 Tax=Adineta ricciae TaxID=249248 RepID=A0A815C4J2_ADIRI|nr:unnamed protein product [Adineta ricciae]CAF1278073.1 unnamed protein product [Adineta ricciae]
MSPKKSKTTKAMLKKSNTMAATAAAGQAFLKQSWGEDKLKQVNAMLNARDNSDTSSDDEISSPPSTAVSSSAAKKTKSKPKLSKATTMKATAKEAKAILGTQSFGDTRTETKRRQAAIKAKEALQEVTKSTGGRKPALKRLGTMANTAKEGKAYIKRTTGSTKKSTTGRKRTGGRAQKTSK